MNTVVNLARDERIAKDAYERVKADWAKLEADELLQVNLDLQLASQTLLGAWPEIKAFRDKIAALPAFDLKQFDDFEDHVLGLVFVQSRYAFATQPPNDLEELVDEATKLRDRLEADAQALALRGLFQPEKLNGLKGGNGYRNLAQDLQALATALEEVLSTVQGRTGTTADEILAATQMATRLTRVVGVREQSPAVLATLAEERLRAFTYVIKIYDEVRSAISYLRRHEGDVEQLAPNLYTGKSPRRKAAEADEIALLTSAATAPVGTAPIATAPAPVVPRNGAPPSFEAASPDPFIP